MHTDSTRTGLVIDESSEYDAPEFAADAVLVGALIISIGIPLYHSYGIIGHPILIGWYVVSAALLPLALPLFIWWLRWGKPPRGVASAMAVASMFYALPVLLCVAAIVYAGLGTLLTGVSVMLYIAATLIAIVRGRLTGEPVRTRAAAMRWAAILLTPLIVLGLTDFLPHGLDAIQGWSIPMPVVSAGAFGCIRGIARWGARAAKGTT